MNILNDERAATIADAVLDDLDSYGGFPPEETIPGLLQAAIDEAQKTSDPEATLDEATDFLVNGGIREG